MRLNQHNLAVGILLCTTALNTHAALTSYTGAGGVGLVYSSVSDITWTQEANLFKTLYDADNTLVSQIAEVTPTYNDSYYGLQTIDVGDFNANDSSMTWWGALAFVNYLNDINYGGSSQWRLPSVGSNPQFGINETGSEQGQLYYNELNRLAYPGTNGSDYGILGDGSFKSSGSAGPFSNAQTSSYWSGAEYAPYPEIVWIFGTYNGFQGSANKGIQLYAWAVSPGQVPLPSAAWFMGIGLLGLLGLKRRERAR